MNRYAKPANFGSRIRTPLLREHFVYRVFDKNGVLLYIGCSMKLAERLTAHRFASRWGSQGVRVTLAGPYNYETAREIEYNAIESERSIYNYSSERRELERIRTRFINRQIERLMAGGATFYEAITPACLAADAAFRNYDHEMLTDLSVPEARRIDAVDYIEQAVA